MDFIKKISFFSKLHSLIAALQEHQNMKVSIIKRKNKAIAKYL